jgi:hypothetical protein
MRRPCMLVTDITSGEQRLIRAAEVSSDPMADILEEQLRLGSSGIVEWGGKAFFLRVETPPVRLPIYEQPPNPRAGLHVDARLLGVGWLRLLLGPWHLGPRAATWPTLDARILGLERWYLCVP